MTVEATLDDPIADHGRYRKIRELHSGSGRVVLAENRETLEHVAIKFVFRSERIGLNLEQEVLSHKNLLHHHVIQFKDIFLTPHYLAIVMEYAAGGDVMEYIRSKRGISEVLARWFFQQLMIGLDYCHRMGVAGREIKLENTLLDDSAWPMVKMCCFEYSVYDLTGPITARAVGVRHYTAPEVVLRDSPNDPYDKEKADIWSCGVFLYVMMVGRYPFERRGENPSRDRHIIVERLKNADYLIPPNCMSADCEDLIRKILVVDPEARASIRDIQSHKWYEENLPPGAKEMNERLEYQEGLQDEAQIRVLFEEARTRS